MTVVLITVTGIVAALAMAVALRQLVAFVRGDGATGRAAPHTPPRSHPADSFEPRSRLA